MRHAGQLLVALVLCLGMMSATASAQTRIPREVYVGAIGGANLSSYTFYPKVTQKMTPCYTAGVALRYIEETYFGLQVELLLTQRAYADDYEEMPDLNYTRKLTYIEVPAMAHIYFNVGKRNQVAIDLGPKVAWFISDAISTNMPDDFGMEGSPYEGYTYEHHSLAIKKTFDYGIQAGLGYEFKLNSKMSLQLQGRYYYGLGNLWPDSKADAFEQSSNSSIQIVAALWWKHVIRGKRVKASAAKQ